MSGLSFQLRDFEGPLDLLLGLIVKHKLDLREIQLLTLIEQYMETISQWQQADLEISSAFLEMASRLVYMKTVLLLPRRQEEGEKLKAELQGQLIEYSLCKLAAQLLGERNGMFARFVRVPMVCADTRPYERRYFRGVLYDARQDAVGRGNRRLPPPAAAFTPLVSRRIVSVDSRIVMLLRRLYTAKAVAYGDVFADAKDRSELVATFLAVLELLKDNRITMHQDYSVSLQASPGASLVQQPSEDRGSAVEGSPQALVTECGG